MSSFPGWIQRWGGPTALVAWAAATVVIGGATLVLHLTPLPLPEARAAEGTEHFQMVHALSGKCPCSVSIAEYLVARRAAVGVTERVLLVDGDDALVAALRGAQFSVIQLDEQSLKVDHGITSVPSLVVHRPDGTVAYRGAHRPRPQMPPTDLEILAEAESGEPTVSLPILGCAVSRSLQDRLDPLGLKYPLWRE